MSTPRCIFSSWHGPDGFCEHCPDPERVAETSPTTRTVSQEEPVPALPVAGQQQAAQLAYDQLKYELLDLQLAVARLCVKAELVLDSHLCRHGHADDCSDRKQLETALGEARALLPGLLRERSQVKWQSEKTGSTGS